MQIKLAKLGEDVREIEVAAADATTVASVLAQAGETGEGFDIRVNGMPTTPDAPMKESESTVVTLVPEIRGGCL